MAEKDRGHGGRATLSAMFPGIDASRAPGPPATLDDILRWARLEAAKAANMRPVTLAEARESRRII